MKSNVVLITGACGLIGSSLVELLLAKDHVVIAADINTKSLLDMENHYKSQNLKTVASDISSEEGIKELLLFMQNLPFLITGFVHAAYPKSTDWGAGLVDSCLDSMVSNMTMQLAAPILLTRDILEYFKINGGGSFVHISSIQGISAPKFEL